MADEKKKSSTSGAVEKLVEEISALSVMELSELVNTLQEKLGISAMPAMATSATAPSGAPEGATATQAGQGGGSPTQTLIMTGSGSNKIAVIKALREINQNWGLKEAKDMTEGVPVEILKDTKAEEVKTASEKLTAAGATVEVK